MSLTADTADAIIAVDRALARYELVTTRARLEVPEVESVLAGKEWEDVKEKILDLMYTALGEGMHFDSLEEARAFRKNVTIDPKAGCGGVHAGDMCNTRETYARWHKEN